MSNIWNIFPRRKGKFSVNPRRPVSETAKFICVLAVIAIAAVLVVTTWSIYMNGESGKVAGGIGLVFLVTELMMSGVCLARVRNEAEPVRARVFSVLISVLAFGMWLAIYLLGVFEG